MFLLDTNIVSLLDPRRHVHTPTLIDWLDRNGARLFLSVMTITEMEAGVFKLRRNANNKRADEITNLIRNILANFGDRVLTIDVETALHIARLGSLTYQQPVPLPDLIIAATAYRHGLTVLTNNMGEFARLGISAIDPLQTFPPE